MNLKKLLAEQPVLVILGVAVAAFGAGFGAYGYLGKNASEIN